MATILRRRPQLDLHYPAVTHFGAVGDGSTVVQTFVANAVASAYASGADLYWPEGTYVTNASIPNFHDVKHYGPGVVKRGSDLFRITPAYGVTNKIYVDPAGSSINDGLTASAPLNTLANAQSRIRAWPTNKGTWQITLAAGTYSEVVTVFRWDSEGQLVFRGPDVSNGAPTAIIDGTSSPSSTAFSPGNCAGQILLYDIKFQNFTSGGAMLSRNSTVYLFNVHSYNNKGGFSYTDHTLLVADKYCRVDGNNIVDSVGFKGLYNSSHDLHGDGAGDAIVVENCDVGLHLGEIVTGHLDFMRIQDCGVGIDFNRGDSGANTRLMEIWRCGIGVLAQNSTWYNNNIDFGLGTANACTIAIETRGGAPEYDWRCGDYTSLTERWQRIQLDRSHTGDTSATTIWTPFTIREGHAPVNSVVRLHLLVRPTLTNATATLNFLIDDDNITGVTIPQNTTLAEVEMEAIYTGSGNWRGWVKMRTGDGTLAFAYGTAASKDPMSMEIPVNVSTTLGSGADTMWITVARAATTIGG